MNIEAPYLDGKGELATPTVLAQIDARTKATMRADLPALAKELKIGGVDGSVPIFATLAEATAWEAANPGKTALTLESASTDTNPPDGGTLTVTGSGDSGSTRTLTVSGVSDADPGLHPRPYRFSLDAGAHWSEWQTEPSWTSTVAAGTNSPRAEVRDGAKVPNVKTLYAPDFMVATAKVYTYDAVTMEDAPIFALDLDDAVGSTTAAQSGSSTAVATVTGDVFTGRAGLAGYARAADFSAGKNITIPTTVQNGYTAWSMCFVAQVDAYTPYGALMIGYGNSGGPGIYVCNAVGGGRAASFQIKTTANTSPVIATGATGYTVDNQPRVYHLTYDGTTLRGYVNGVEAASLAVTGATATTTAMKINYLDYFDGAMNGFRIYDKALTPARVLAHAQGAGVA